MRVCFLFVMGFGLLCLNACPKGAGGNQQRQTAQRPVPPTSGEKASPASPKKKKRPKVVAVSPQGEKIEVQHLISSNTPYLGQYSELDKWVWDNFDPGEEDLAVQGKGIGPEETLLALYVTADGYVVPHLEALRFELEQRKAGKPPGAKPGPFALYAIGVLPEKIRDKNRQERARLTAEYMPPIPLWLSTKPPYWALILPDGSVVIKGKLGQGRDYFPDLDNLHLLDGLKVSHYSTQSTFATQGDFIAQTEPGQLWCELFFPNFEEALKRHGIGRDNVREFGYYLQFLNLANKEKTGYYYYDGTPLSQSEISIKPDYNRLFEMYGKYLPEMYIRQQEKDR